jgi:hypothetical protein
MLISCSLSSLITLAFFLEDAFLFFLYFVWFIIIFAFYILLFKCVLSLHENFLWKFYKWSWFGLKFLYVNFMLSTGIKATQSHGFLSLALYLTYYTPLYLKQRMTTSTIACTNFSSVIVDHFRKHFFFFHSSLSISTPKNCPLWQAFCFSKHTTKNFRSFSP